MEYSLIHSDTDKWHIWIVCDDHSKTCTHSVVVIDEILSKSSHSGKGTFNQMFHMESS